MPVEAMTADSQSESAELDPLEKRRRRLVLRATWMLIAVAMLSGVTTLAVLVAAEERSKRSAWNFQTVGTVTDVQGLSCTTDATCYRTVTFEFRDRTGAVRLVERTRPDTVQKGERSNVYQTLQGGVFIQGDIIKGSSEDRPWRGFWGEFIVLGVVVSTLTTVLGGMFFWALCDSVTKWWYRRRAQLPVP
jgi:hypothetical protein